MSGLNDLLTAQAAARGNAPALFYRGATLSYAGLARDSRRLAASLAALGIGRGDRVALWLPNVPAYLLTVFACARLGAIAMAVNTRYRSSEVGDIIGRSGAKALLLWPAFLDIPFLDILADVDPAALQRLETVILYGEAGDRPVAALPVSHVRTVGFGSLLGDAEAPASGGPDDGCAIFTTSGTTKAPKFVLHRQRGIADHARDVVRGLHLDAPDTVSLQALPFCGVFGFCQAMATLAAGAPMHLQPVFDAEAAAKLLSGGGVSHLIASDEMILRLLATTSVPEPFPTLRSVGFAAFSRPPEETVAAADRRGVCLIGLYGMSEVQALFSCQSPSAPAVERAKRGGRPVSPQAEVRVCDPETGRLLPAGESGELLVKGPSLMAGYYQNPEATAAAFTADGFLHTGDLGYLEADGRFVFLTRMGDVLRLGGFLVSPAEIENHLQKHATVDGAQVVGVQTATAPRAVAFVTLKPGAGFDEAALRDWCRSGLAGYKVPMRVVRLDEFPVTASANGMKILRTRLRDMAAALDKVG